MTIPLERAEAIRLEPGDVVVLHSEERALDMATLEGFREELRGSFPGHKVVIVNKGFRLEYIREGQAE